MLVSIGLVIATLPAFILHWSTEDLSKRIEQVGLHVFNGSFPFLMGIPEIKGGVLTFKNLLKSSNFIMSFFWLDPKEPKDQGFKT